MSNPIEIDISGDGGVLKKILTPGTGDETPPSNSKVKVHYVGTLLDGTKFDSSRDRGEPFEFQIGKGSVIKAWDQGVATMKRGEVCTLTCAPEYAYGAAGSPPKIPANATLKFDVELIDWNDKIDVTNDGGVLKKMVQSAPSSEYQMPNDFSSCVVSFVVKCAGKVICEKKEETVEIGADPTLFEGLEHAIKSLKRGEKAEVTIKPNYAFGAKGDDTLGVPPNATLDVDLELHSFTKSPDKWSMSREQKFENAEKRKQIGNQLFKADALPRALKVYKSARELIKNEKDLDDNGKELIVSINSNMAAVNLKLGNYGDAKSNCADALKVDSKNVKALFRSAQANVALANPEDAVTELKVAIEVDPGNQSVQALLAKARAIIKAQRAKERSTYGGIFERLSKLNEKESAKSAKEAAAAEERPEVDMTESSEA